MSKADRPEKISDRFGNLTFTCFEQDQKTTLALVDVDVLVLGIVVLRSPAGLGSASLTCGRATGIEGAGVLGAAKATVLGAKKGSDET